MRKRYRRLVDAPKNKEEIEIFDGIYEDYKEMFKKDFIFIGIIGRKLFGNDKKRRYRFGEYTSDKIILEFYEESKTEKSLEYLK